MEEMIMIVEELYLEGFVALSLSEIETIRVTPEERMILVLGTNGSGKSSLLSEWNPLPAVRQMYRPKGKKVVRITHEQHSFLLTSDFSKGNYHSFIMNDKELNEGHTQTVQKELVERHLNYTSQIHQVLSGAIRFTDMTPMARREILMQINPSDLSYAKRLYEAFRVNSRDTQGAIKHVTAKNIDMLSKLSSLELASNLKEEVEGIEEEIRSLMPFTKKNSTTTTDNLTQVEQIVKSLEDNVRRWFDAAPNLGDLGVTNYDELIERIGSLEASTVYTKDNMKRNATEQMEMRELLGEVDTDQLTPEELKERLTIVESDLKALGGREPNIKVKHDVILTELKELLRQHSEAIDGNVVKIFSREEEERIRKDNEDIITQAATYRQRLSTLDSKLKHLKEDQASNITCPNCTTTFSLTGGDIVSEIKDIEGRIDRGRDLMVSVNKRKVVMDVAMTELSDYMSLRDRVKSIRTGGPHQHSNLTDFWTNAPSIDASITSPSKFSEYTQKVIREVERDANLCSLIEERDYCLSSLKAIERFGANIPGRLARLESEHDKYASEIDRSYKELERLKTAKEDFVKYSRVVENCEELVGELDTLFKSSIDTAIAEDSTVRCNFLQTRLGSIKHLLNTKDSLESAIASNEADIEDLTKRKRAYDLLVSNLSPTHGLIADEMVNFINSFIEQLNGITEYLWQYRLEVLPCQVEASGSLDYKFPLQVEDESTPDINKSSTGQADVINLAFVLVMRSYLNLLDYPMYFDETGSTFDETHRAVLLSYIKQLLETNQCSQVFMINHHATVHGGLSNHETIVLDGRNITKPSVYNQNVEITYRS